MGTRRAANDPSVRVDLTPRQREVLDLLARGATNGEIAERLGITLDGAKWHVREILARLDVDSREEAAEWWRTRERRGPAAWLARLPWPVTVSAAAVGGVAALVVSLAALSDGPASPEPDAGTATQPELSATTTPSPRRIETPLVPQPPLREVQSGPGWRLFVADDGKGVPPVEEAVLAVTWDLATPYVDVLDRDGRIAMRVQVGYRPMARVNVPRGSIVISDWIDLESGRIARALTFALEPPAFAGEVRFAHRRVNSTVFANWITLSADGAGSTGWNTASSRSRHRV